MIVSGQAVAVAGPGKAPQHASQRSHDGLPQMPSTVIKTGRLSIRLGHDDLGKAIDRATPDRRPLRRVHQLEQHLVRQARVLHDRAARPRRTVRPGHDRPRRSRPRRRAVGAAERRGRRPAAGRPVGTRAQPARPVTGADTAHEPGRHGQRHDQDPERAVRHPGPDRGARRPAALPARPGGHVDHHDAPGPAGRRTPPPGTADGDRKRASPQLAACHRRRHRRDRRAPAW